jgi:2-keto-4-pentenoate hydratase/2-oxohepta-3-ene-1,7-dioic acid hydratase in catechol pathway
MRVANLSGRLVVITGPPGSETAFDVEKNSGGRFGPQPMAVYEEWDSFRTWAAAARWEGDSPVDPCGLGSPAPAPRQVLAIGLNYRDHAADDVIFTGTPAGVGLGRNPPRWLADGDILTSRIEGIGELRHRFIA